MRILIKSKTLIPLLLMILTLILCLNTVFASKEIYVNTTGNDISGTGTAKNPYLTIQKGLDNVDTDGVLRIANGQYSGAKNTKLTLNKNVKIIGQNNIKTVIDGKNVNWIFKIQSKLHVTIYNLKIINGRTTGRGGAIKNQGNLILNRCYITKNIANEYGGGIYNTGNCTVIGCTITKNKQTGTNNKYAGGGIVNYGGYCTIIKSNIMYNTANANSGGIGTQYGNCTIKNCEIQFNKAKNGGGIVNYAGNCNIIKTLVSKNIADNIGGIGIQYGNCTIKYSIIKSNKASKGAGITNFNGILTVSNSLINNNTSTGDGGSILNYCIFNQNNSDFDACVLNLNGCCFRGNSAGGDGGVISNRCGIGVCGRGFGACVLNLNGCCFRGNSAGGDGGVISNRCGIGVCGRGFGACVLNLNYCNFKANSAGKDGGVIYEKGAVDALGHGFGACVLNLNGCIFKTNTARNGGAIWKLVKVKGSTTTKTSLNVNECTFIGNKAIRGGGAIWNNGTANVNFNRLMNNKAHHGNDIYTTTSMNATDNWWGCNDPDFKSLISSFNDIKVSYTPWLYLTLTSNPKIIHKGSTSILIANFNHHTNGKTITAINPLNGYIPNGSNITFTINLNKTGYKFIEKYTNRGFAFVVYNEDGEAGTAYVSLFADGQILKTYVIIKPTHTKTIVAFNSETVEMQKTGSPLNGILTALFMILSGFFGTWTRTIK